MLIFAAIGDAQYESEIELLRLRRILKDLSHFYCGRSLNILFPSRRTSRY